MTEDNRRNDRFGAWTSPDEEALVDAIAGFDLTLAEMLAEHEEEYEMILSTLFMADVAGWATQQYEAGHHEVVSEFFTLLERHFEDGDQHVQNLIAVGFVESMPWTAAPAGGLRTLLGPRLAKVFNEVNW